MGEKQEKNMPQRSGRCPRGTVSLLERVFWATGNAKGGQEARNALLAGMQFLRDGANHRDQPVSEVPQ